MHDHLNFGAILATVTADGKRHLEELHPDAARQKKKAILSGKHPEIISFKVYDTALCGKRADWKAKVLPTIEEAPKKVKKPAAE